MYKRFFTVLVVLAGLMVSIGNCGERQKVLCFGDSITWGDQARGKCWVDLLSRRHLNYDFVNYGRCGRVTADFEGLGKAISEHGDSDIVFIFLGVNDLKHATSEKVRGAVGNISRMVDTIGEKIKGAEVVILSPCGVNEKDMSEVNINKGYADNTQNCLVEMENEYKKLAAEKKIVFLSLLRVVSAENFADGLHPDPAGQKQIAEFISKNYFMPKDDLPADLKDKKLAVIWHDEFESDKIDESKWHINGDHKRNAGYWHKSECYVDGVGNLIIRTRKEGDKYLSGSMQSRGKFAHKYGYWVMRCKFPIEEGHWPAFWLYCDSMGKIGDEGNDGSEIDIMERPHSHLDHVAQTIHWDGYSKEHHKSAYNGYRQEGLRRGWHIFSLYWTKDEYVYYVDGKETWRTSAGGVSDVEQFIILSEEVAEFTGDISKAALPDYYIVDYVRVYDSQ